jgi:hypothetical protein
MRLLASVALAIAVPLLAACEAATGPSLATIAAALDKLEEPFGGGFGGGWVLYPPNSACVPEDLRDAKIVERGACLPIPGPSTPTWTCNVVFRTAAGGETRADVTMSKYPDTGWNAKFETSAGRSQRFFTPC